MQSFTLRYGGVDRQIDLSKTRAKLPLEVAKRKTFAKYAKQKYRTPLDDVELFSFLIRAATSLAKKNPNYGVGYDLPEKSFEAFKKRDDVVKISKLLKDLTYQRDLNIDHVNEQLRVDNYAFDHAAAGTIDVMIRPDGKMIVWDGWHRLMMALICGIEYIQIHISKHPKTRTLKACRAREAQLFNKRNRFSKKVTSEQGFAAACTAGDEVALELDAYLKSMGLDFTGRRDGDITLTGKDNFSIAWKRYPTQIMTDAIRIIMKTFPNDVRMQGGLVASIATFLHHFDENNGLLSLQTKNVNKRNFLLFLKTWRDGEKKNGRPYGQTVLTGKVIKGAVVHSLVLRLIQEFNAFATGPVLGLKRIPITKTKIQFYATSVKLEQFIVDAFCGGNVSLDIQCDQCGNEMHVSVKQKNIV